MTDEKRQTAGMINVRVREHHSVDLLDGDREAGILLVALVSLTLKQPTVENNCLPGNSQDVARARYFTCGSNEFNLHKSLDTRSMMVGVR